MPMALAVLGGCGLMIRVESLATRRTGAVGMSRRRLPGNCTRPLLDHFGRPALREAGHPNLSG